MTDHLQILQSHFASRLPTASSASSIADMRIDESKKLRVLIAATGSADVQKAHALINRLSRNPKIETRVVVNELRYANASRAMSSGALQLHPALSLPNHKYHVDTASEHSELEEDEFYHQKAYELREWADLLVLAPIDANMLAKMLHGIADCLLLEIIRGWDVGKKIILVPGMSTAMWENPMTKKQLSKLRRKWQWVHVKQEILWNYDEKTRTKCFAGWDGFNELVDHVNCQADLLAIGHDVDIASGAAAPARHNIKTDRLLPNEVWTMIFERVGDWEVAQALNIFTKLPIPAEWLPKPNERKDELSIYLRALEWTILTCPTNKVIEKLKGAPKGMKFLSSLCVKLVIKFCLTDLLTYMEANMYDVFWASFGLKILPTKASAVYGRTEILEWWRTSPSFLSKDYTHEAMDGASKSGFTHILDWWLQSGLPLKHTEFAMEQASSKGHIAVLDWWKQACVPTGRHHDDATAIPDILPLQLKPGRALLAAAQNDQALVLRWWDASGIPVTHSELVAKTASQHGHVAVLQTWSELKGEKLAFDSQVLVGPTKNGHVEVLEWWREYSRDGGRVEYKTCDIEEALEDSVGNELEEKEVKRWWARNGLNLGVQVSEWTKVKVL